jgi:hypothetical protein
MSDEIVWQIINREESHFCYAHLVANFAGAEQFCAFKLK